MCSSHIIPKFLIIFTYKFKNFKMIYLHLFFCCLLISSGLFVAFSINSIESVLFLILAFCNAAAILFLFNAEFLGLVFIIIYVGAIAVLFLFVIMMLNIKSEDQDFNIIRFIQNNFIPCILSCFFVLLCFSLLKSVFLENENIIFQELYKNVFNFDCLNNIDVLGQVLYNYFLVCFLIAGLVLLIALIGAIVLTLRFNNLQKGQSVFRQLSRTENLLAFFK